MNHKDYKEIKELKEYVCWTTFLAIVAIFLALTNFHIGVVEMTSEKILETKSSHYSFDTHGEDINLECDVPIEYCIFSSSFYDCKGLNWKWEISDWTYEKTDNIEFNEGGHLCKLKETYTGLGFSMGND